MDHETFQEHIGSMTRFPEPLRQSALDTGSKLDDEGRASLAANLQDVYAKFEPEDIAYEAVVKDAEMKLEEFRKSEMPALRAEAEAADRGTAVQDLESQLDQ